MTDKRAKFNIAFATAASVLIMGYINGYSSVVGKLFYMIPDKAGMDAAVKAGKDPATVAKISALKVFGGHLTAETGNLANLGKFLGQGTWAKTAWPAFIVALCLYLGFAIGNGFAYAFKGKFENKRSQFVFSWSTFVLPLILLPFYYQHIIPPVPKTGAPSLGNEWILMLIVGFAIGAGLSGIRQFYHLDMNNAMHTGSARYFGLWFWQAIVKRARTENKEVFNFLAFTLLILLFAGGTGLCWALAGPMLVKNAAPTAGVLFNFMGHKVTTFDLGFIIICVIPYFFLPSAQPVDQAAKNPEVLANDSRNQSR